MTAAGQTPRDARAYGAGAAELADLAAAVRDVLDREQAAYTPLSPVARSLRQASGLLLVASRTATAGGECRACGMPRARCLASTSLRCCGGCSHTASGRGAR